MRKEEFNEHDGIRIGLGSEGTWQPLLPALPMTHGQTHAVSVNSQHPHPPDSHRASLQAALPIQSSLPQRVFEEGLYGLSCFLFLFSSACAKALVPVKPH